MRLFISCTLPLALAAFSSEQAALRAHNAALGVPVPSPAQISALAHNFVVFDHWSMCTFTGCQWNTAVSPSSDFTPPDDMNISQWMSVYSAMGATQVCLTVRHVGGFTLWPSTTTNYSVAHSPWQGGGGDVARDFVAAARAAGISPCFYVILGFDIDANHSGVPGPQYLANQVTVLTELLTRYGPIDRLWWDNYAIGCCQPVTHEGFYCPGGGTTSTPGPECPGWQTVIDTVRAINRNTAIVPGPDGCLVNGETEGGTYPLYHATRVAQNSYSCTDASRVPTNESQFFAVVESDFSILNPGDNWFWSAQDPFLNASEILSQFNTKFEQGANLILNVPASSAGVVPDEYAAQLRLFAAARAATFSDPRSTPLGAPASAACADLSVTVAVTGDFDTVLLSEDLTAGQVIAAYTLEAQDAATGAWRALTAGVHGKTVGLRLLDSVGLQMGVRALRLNCSGDLAPPVPAPPAKFVNSAGSCMGMPDGATFPCWVGDAQDFRLCPLVASSCDGPASVWSDGGSGTLVARGAAADAVINIDCNACAAGTHAKIIEDAGCSCASALSYDAIARAIRVTACPGMCLSNGIVGGALKSCAGDEPSPDDMVHLVPCADAAGASGWTREAAERAGGAAVATVKTLAAYVARRVTA
jgi:alpha-L-fucosidase